MAEIRQNDRQENGQGKSPPDTVSSAAPPRASIAVGPALADNAPVTDPVTDSAAVIAELRSEITLLRGELRLMRIANAELERVAVRDTLTPLYNRRYFLTALNERLNRAKRYNSKAAMLFLDVNRMKFINDAFGHSAGDFALIHIAQLIQANIRTTDVAARIGGDEFAIIIEEVDKDAAIAKVEELEQILRATPCDFGSDFGEEKLMVSASIGFTMLMPNDNDESAIERADADMYARKRAWHAKVKHQTTDTGSAAA